MRRSASGSGAGPKREREPRERALEGRRSSESTTSPGTAARRSLAAKLGLALALSPALALDQASAQDLPHPTDMALPAVEFERPDPDRFRVRVGNGLEAYVVPESTVPLVRFTALIGAGTAHDETAGAAEALLAAFRAGPADEGDFGAALDEMAAELVVRATPEEMEVTLEVPAEDAARALRLFSGTLMAPAVSASLVEGVRTRLESARPGTAPDGGEYDGSLDAAVALFHGGLYGEHSYGPGHDAASLRSLDADAVRAFHRAVVTPDNVVLAVSGDFDPGRMPDLVRTAFAGWRGRAGGLARAPALSAPAKRQVRLHPLDRLQAWVVIGHELPPVPEDDRAALEVMNYILGGGHFDTRLFRATRDRRGLTNDASGFPVAYRRGPGSYTFRTYGRPEVVPLLIHLTLEEIERIRSEPVSERDLFVAHGALAEGEFPMWFADGHATARTFAEERLRFGDHDWTDDYRDRIRAVDADDVLTVARRYLRPDRLQITVLGPADRVLAAPSLEGEPPLSDVGEIMRATDGAYRR